jgi:uncharacterized RDD family membrane protein YckC
VETEVRAVRSDASLVGLAEEIEMFGPLGWQELGTLIILFGLPIGLVAALIGSRPTNGLAERFYTPDQLETATPRRRLGGYLLESVLAVLTLGVGWLIWFIIVAPNGQTPAKQLLGMYIMRDDGSRAGGGYVWLREFVVKGLLFGVIAMFTAYIAWVLAALWCTWDRDRQTLWDKVGTTHVTHSPRGFKPLTANEAALADASFSVRTGSGSPAAPTVVDRLRELQDLRDRGILSAAEYEDRRQKLAQEL